MAAEDRLSYLFINLRSEILVVGGGSGLDVVPGDARAELYAVDDYFQGIAEVYFEVVGNYLSLSKFVSVLSTFSWRKAQEAAWIGLHFDNAPMGWPSV